MFKVANCDFKRNIQKSIDTLNENFVSDKDFKNFVIYKGQKFEADAAYIDIYQQATVCIYVVDDYVNTKTLQLLSQKKTGVEVILFTQNGHGRNGFLTTAVVNDFANQYPPLRIKSNPDCHDRLIVTDYGLPTEQAYHCGASSKDAGKKLCAINKIENTAMIHPVIDSLLLGADRAEFASFGCNFKVNPYSIFEGSVLEHSVIYDKEEQLELVRSCIRDSLENFYEYVDVEHPLPLAQLLDVFNVEIMA